VVLAGVFRALASAFIGELPGEGVGINGGGGTAATVLRHGMRVRNRAMVNEAFNAPPNEAVCAEDFTAVQAALFFCKKA
jgi:hypothetical protein